MKIMSPMQPDTVPFTNPLETDTGRLVKAITNLNGMILPIDPEKEPMSRVRARVFYAATKAGVATATAVHDDILYLWRIPGTHPANSNKEHNAT